MAKQYMSTGISSSPTISAAISDSTFAADTEKLTNLAGRAVKLTSDGEFTLCDTAGEAAIGIVTIDNDNEIKKGDSISVQIRDNGVAFVSAAVTAGDPLTTDADGAFVKATSGHVRAVALASGAANSFVRVMMANYPLATT